MLYRRDDMENMEFKEKVAAYSHAHGLLPEGGGRMLVALSGGADSVALLLVLEELGVEVVAAHCNFHLRGAESDRDERFVLGLCAERGVRLEVRDFDVESYVRERGVSVEMACRELRYEWFGELLDEMDCESVAVAHHRDDNIETFFLNALRGTGIAGLAGMRPSNGKVVRPLLCVTRKEIEEYLASRGQTYVTDSTNLESEVKRNKLRNRVLPIIETEFPGCRSTLERTVANVRECNELYADGVELMRQIVCDEENEQGEMVIDTDCLMSMSHPAMLLFEMLKGHGFKKAQCEAAVGDVAEGGSVGNRYDARRYRLHIYRGKIKVLLSEDVPDEEIAVDLSGGEMEFPVRLKIADVEGRLADGGIDGKHVIALSEDVKRCEKVVLRHRRDADRIAPFGMRGTKLVSDLFTDLHMEEREKNRVWLLEADGEILWVLGYRASRHYAVKDTDRRYVRIEWR